MVKSNGVYRYVILLIIITNSVSLIKVIAQVSPDQPVPYDKKKAPDPIDSGVQRTQVVLWNLVLGIYFIWYVINNKSMPVFDNTLLILAGVSSILYLSKGPENPSASPSDNLEPKVTISRPA